MSTRCPSCDETLPAEARFCWRCGQPLPAAAAPEERRMVSVLFCDLAGFTERSDRADPEDVRRVLMPFHSAVQREVERYGGYLDKFIGDGALGVFGAPVAHEDDPLRAVEAGLAILREVQELARTQPGLSLQARAGVATGVAVVQLGSGPQVGEAIAGDVVNTASRLQGIAEPGTLVVDATVHPVIAPRVESVSIGSVAVKGKREPLEVWRIDEVRPLSSSPGPSKDEPPFVGRDEELGRLHNAWDAMVHGGVSRTIAIVGEPGVGKSRLVAEAERACGGRWLWGRCHPYGEGVTFAALAQLVREGLRVSPDTAADVVDRRVRELAASIEPDPEEAAWLARHVLLLLGMGDDRVGPPRLDEASTAWGRALCGIGDDAPLALVVDDAHWAEPALADVLTRLPLILVEAPVLLVVVGRLETRDRWPREQAAPETIHLLPLDAAPIAGVLRAVAPEVMATLSDDRLTSVVEAAGGNPLYAVEYGRLLAEHVDAVTGIPDSIHSLIAARLDGLPPDERAAVQDAAVLGRRFRASALPSIGGGTDSVTLPAVLTSLRRRGIIRPEADDDAFAFSQSLVPEIAYGRLTRPQRVRRHRAAADWFVERRATLPDAVDAEAYHRRAALDLARELGSADEPILAAEAREAFRAAAARAQQLDLARAVDLLRDALALTSPDDPALPDLLVAVTSAARRAGLLTPSEAAHDYRRAVEIARRHGDRVTEAEALARAAMDLGFDGATERARQTLDEALALLDHLPPSLTTVRAVLVRAEELDFAGRYDDTRAWLARAERILDDMPGSGLVPPRPADEPLDPRTVEFTNMLLHLRGDVRCVGGDLDGGLEDIRATIGLARAVGSANSELQALSYLSEWTGMIEGPAATLELQDRALRLSAKRGYTRSEWWTRAERGWALADLERWDEVTTTTDRIIEAGEALTGDATYAVGMWLRLRARAAAGRTDEAAALAEETLARARAVEQLQLLLPVLTAVGLVWVATDRSTDALHLVREAIEATRDDGELYRMLLAPDLVRISLAAGDRALAGQLIAGLASPIPRPAACLASADALLAEHDGDTTAALVAWRKALAAWEPMGATIERRLAREAIERLSQGEVPSG